MHKLAVLERFSVSRLTRVSIGINVKTKNVLKVKRTNSGSPIYRPTKSLLMARFQHSLEFQKSPK